MPARLLYEHIALNDSQVPVVAGTTTKVVELVLDHVAYGWSPEELRFQHPHLTMSQVHSALAYYWDHKAEMERDIEERLRAVDDIRLATPPSAFAARIAAERPH